MAMHNDFADWYRAAAITPTQELLAARWEAVAQLAPELKGEEIVAMLKLYVIKPAPTYQAPDWFEETFREHDAAFPSRDNVEELRVLAGAILRQVMELDGPTSTAAALGLLSSSFGNRAQELASRDHVDAAAAFIAKKAESLRTVAFAPSVKVASPNDKRREELMPAGTFTQNPPLALREPIINALNEQTTHTNTALATLSAALWRVNQMQREELNMLWWLQSKVSRELKKPFSELAPGIAQIILPSELADLTVFLPGPVAVTGLLMAALHELPSVRDDLSIAQAINAVPVDWREKRAKQTVLPTEAPSVCPILLALHRSLDTDGPADWLPVYRKQSDVSIETHVTSLTVANQLYTETLFLRALAGIPK